MVVDVVIGVVVVDTVVGMVVFGVVVAVVVAFVVVVIKPLPPEHNLQVFLQFFWTSFDD